MKDYAKLYINFEPLGSGIVGGTVAGLFALSQSCLPIPPRLYMSAGMFLALFTAALARAFAKKMAR